MKLIRFFLKIFYILYKLPFFSLVRLYCTKSDFVLWVNRITFKNLKGYLDGGGFLNDAAYLKAIAKYNVKYRIVFGDSIGRIRNSTVLFSHSYDFNTFKFYDHSILINTVVNELEKQGNNVCPSYHESLYWENKEYMHQSFEKIGIPSPKSKIVSVNSDFPDTFDLPFLIKELHSSGSAGVYKISNKDEFYNLLSKFKKRGVARYILQELLNISRDLRVILIDDKIVLHYWRINNSKEWKPTSTSRGSSVDFENFPERWRTYIIETFKKLDLRTGGFDIAWQNDDIETEPYFLEISPSYQPNPSQPEKYKELSYYQYKSVIKGNDAYYRKFIDIVFDIKEDVFKTYFNIK